MWGTSGWNAYQPWMTFADFIAENFSDNLTGSRTNADWGVYNAISNGGNEPNKWRTLTKDEWLYLFQNNNWTLGQVEGMLCYMLVPKDFNGKEITILSESTTESDVAGLSVPSENTYTAESFKELENMGVVVLPCGGSRHDNSVNLDLNLYCSSSAEVGAFVYGFYFSEGIVIPSEEFPLDFGMSVRLVHDLNLDIHFVNPDGTTLLDTAVARGATPTYTREEPTMASKAYTFDFVGWNKKFVAAESDMTYTAVYDSTQVLYTSIFKNYDGTSLDTIKKCAYDSVQNGKELTHRDAYYHYVFSEWSRDESQISDGILVYTAVYDTVQALYTCVFNNYDGTLVHS